jgi:MoxR-like ATPase
MADGLWATVCDVASSVGETIKQMAAPTKSATEIELTQKARQVKAADDVAEAYEKLSGRDETKVNTGITMFQKILSGNIDKSKEDNKDG